MIEGHWNEDYSDSWADKDLRHRLHDRFQAMIDLRRDRSGGEVLKEWTGLAPRHGADDGRPGRRSRRGIHPFAAWTYLWAVVQNAHNIWTALGVASKDRDSEATSLCLESAIYWLDMRLQAKAIPALRVRTGEQRVGYRRRHPARHGDRAEVRAIPRAVGPAEPRSDPRFSWDGDPGPYLTVFSPVRAAGRSDHRVKWREARAKRGPHRFQPTSA